MKVPFLSHPGRHWLSVAFSILPILIGKRWNLKAVLLCIPQTTLALVRNVYVIHMSLDLPDASIALSIPLQQPQIYLPFCWNSYMLSFLLDATQVLLYFSFHSLLIWKILYFTNSTSSIYTPPWDLAAWPCNTWLLSCLRQHLCLLSLQDLNNFLSFLLLCLPSFYPLSFPHLFNNQKEKSLDFSPHQVSLGLPYLLSAV